MCNKRQVLIQEVGGLLFNEEGNFIDMIRRGSGHCHEFVELPIENLPESVSTYVESNYAESEIIRARLGFHDETEEIHVLLDIGILIFDIDGNFIEFMERRRNHHG